MQGYLNRWEYNIWVVQWVMGIGIGKGLSFVSPIVARGHSSALCHERWMESIRILFGLVVVSCWVMDGG